MQEKELKFRTLRADEIQVRVGQTGVAVNKKTNKPQGWATLLLYKDARVDIKLLDETVGRINWQRHHSRNNANCIVSIWDNDKKIWVEKEDTGVESQFESEKGLASSSFKRACTNWGIGLALYTSPRIFISEGEDYIPDQKHTPAVKNRFIVSEIDYDEDEKINRLQIKNLALNKAVFDWKSLTYSEEKSKKMKEQIQKVENG